MIPVTLVTGFLGSGKTTLLQEIIANSPSRRLTFLVNEFSSLDVDGGVLAGTGADVVSLPGGSIFCRCLVTGFIATLRSILEKHPDPQKPLDGLVVEASGVADPRVIGRMLEETGLDSSYRIGAVVTVLDPDSFLKLVHTLPNIRAQVESADLILLNKVDLHPPEKVQRAEEVLQEMRPRARIARCERCRIDLAMIPKLSGAENLEGEYAPCRDPRYRSLSIPVSGDVRLESLEALFEDLAEDLYRVKGYVSSEGCLWRVDLANGRLSLTRAQLPSAEPGLAIVLRGDAPRATLERLEALGGLRMR